MRIFFSAVIVELVRFCSSRCSPPAIQGFTAILAGLESIPEHFYRKLATVNRNYFIPGPIPAFAVTMPSMVSITPPSPLTAKPIE